MFKRLEYKYLVPMAKLETLRSEIMPFAKLDPYASREVNHQYLVRSLYYDTLGHDCYLDKIEGVRVRKKFRIRAYNSVGDDTVVFLEIKRKRVNFIGKDRAPLLYKNLNLLFSNHNPMQVIISNKGNGHERSNARHFLYHYYRLGLRPTVQVLYNREAYYYKFNDDLRITFDTNIRSTVFSATHPLFNGAPTTPVQVLRNYFIFEVKFTGGFPSWLNEIVRRLQLTRMALSKYTICLDSHDMTKKFVPLVLRGCSQGRLRLIDQKAGVTDV